VRVLPQDLSIRDGIRSCVLMCVAAKIVDVKRGGKGESLGWIGSGESVTWSSWAEAALSSSSPSPPPPPPPLPCVDMASTGNPDIRLLMMTRLGLYSRRFRSGRERSANAVKVGTAEVNIADDAIERSSSRLLNLAAVARQHPVSV
jgi:hypothetical protein